MRCMIIELLQFTCEACKKRKRSYEDLTLHHSTYDETSKVRDKLVLLCNDCNKLAHSEFLVGLTRGEFLQEMKKELLIRNPIPEGFIHVREM